MTDADLECQQKRLDWDWKAYNTWVRSGLEGLPLIPLRCLNDRKALIDEVRLYKQRGVVTISRSEHDEKHEVFVAFYDCPSCKQDAIMDGSSCCRDCGVRVEWQRND